MPAATTALVRSSAATAVKLSATAAMGPAASTQAGAST
jgi:hypothetical protein